MSYGCRPIPETADAVHSAIPCPTSGRYKARKPTDGMIDLVEEKDGADLGLTRKQAPGGVEGSSGSAMGGESHAIFHAMQRNKHSPTRIIG